MIRPNRLAIIGFGRLGRACALALQDCHDLELAGVVRHTQTANALPQPFEHVKVAEHLRDLTKVDAALVCVPAQRLLEVAREVIQQRVPIVECAILEGRALEAHYASLDEAARHHRVPAVIGAGWSPGALPLVRRLFEVLIPRGHTQTRTRPGRSLYHSAELEGIPGIRAALTHEFRAADRRMQRYVYVKLEEGADSNKVEEAIRADPLYASEETLVFPVGDLAPLEDLAAGVVLERRGTEAAKAGPHASLLLEARFNEAEFSARIMLDGARRLPLLAPGAHSYALSL